MYHIAKETLIKFPGEFKSLILCLGSINVRKTFLDCIGKFMRGSRYCTACVKNRLFGPEFVDSVLSGSDYEYTIECTLNIEYLIYIRLNSVKNMSKSTLSC